ncbi:hypothetical protein [Longimicrobium terrae]|uniref:Uncharacterized protein n=1 Tax=Longimicrobium terrae TaxID=1639882 RepID=A0A841GWP4_9BACT|nr:hypothetical protein [Longimicrobium terrae]MBB4635798.1 hypothetical protein [Longimicrobium terrae]MBB6070193.1 hypothetical protein [Longimicrobium terrae]NNC30699.1 hypothetical protein [Longimicrobium terrae]
MANLRMDTESLTVTTFEVANAVPESDRAVEAVQAATVGCQPTRNICECNITGCC